MHSSQFKAAAQKCDYHFGTFIVAMADVPLVDGNYPSAWIVTADEFSSEDASFSFHRVVFPSDRDPFMDSGHYNLTRSRAMELLIEHM